jgi:hypothetical protein
MRAALTSRSTSTSTTSSTHRRAWANVVMATILVWRPEGLYTA